MPRVSNAGIIDALSRVARWWSERGVEGAGSASSLSRGEDAEAGDEPGDEPTALGQATAGMCVVPREPPSTKCEIGSGFLCVDTPPGGVAANHFTLRGTTDRKGSVVASIHISVQNEYTKKTVSVDTSAPSGADCRGELEEGRSFCLDAAGFFAARVPLLEKGPATISVSASRLSGGPVQKNVRTSRVVALTLDEKNLAFDPNVREKTAIDGTHVTATLDLLGECQFCDFIGASTGGVSVTVENVMTDASGAVRMISCPTTIEQGGQGRFVIGVPVGPGKNSLTITACNAASAEGSCPRISGIEFEAGGSLQALKVISPPPLPAYDSGEYPNIAWEFSLGGKGECVDMQFNREPAREVCADEAGRYRADLSPRAGINVATLSRGGAEEFAWTFGWGKVISPHANGGTIEVPDAARVALPASTVNQIILPLINNFLNSDELGRAMEGLLGGGKGKDSGDSSAAQSSESAIPKCGSGGSMSESLIEIRGTPVIEEAKISDLVFGEGRIDLKAVLRGLRVGVNLAPDKDGDGLADRDPLPLVVAFRKAIVEISLEVKRGEDGKVLVLLSSPHDDCSYKSHTYCTKSPAALVPKNFVGGANDWGGFVSCDVKEAEGDAIDACRALNSLNSQTGLVSEQVLDAINGAIYCSGSAALTGATREGISFGDLNFGCAEGEECEGGISKILPNFRLPLAAVLRDGLQVDQSGIRLAANLVVGDAELYSSTPAPYRIPQAGLVTGGQVGAKPFSSAGDHRGDIAAAIAMDALSAALFAATVQGDGRSSRGLLDFDIDEDFFASLGFDFVESCDRFSPTESGEESQPTLCFIRPRVIELLGPPLSTYGYLPAKQPLMLSVRGNRALSPRISVRGLEELPVVAGAQGEGEEDLPTGELLELELGGVALSFYALEIDESKPEDEFGNLAVKRDAKGRPIIRSMRPGVSNPLDGQIVSFDLTLLLAAEIGRPAAGLGETASSEVSVRLLADRSRLIVTPVAGSNSTTVPAAGLISSLTEKLKLAIAGMGSREAPLLIPIPAEVDLSSQDPDGLAGMLGIGKLSIAPDGFSFDSDPDGNSVAVALRVAISQLLHVDGKPVEYSVPR